MDGAEPAAPLELTMLKSDECGVTLPLTGRILPLQQRALFGLQDLGVPEDRNVAELHATHIRPVREGAHDVVALSHCCFLRSDDGRVDLLQMLNHVGQTAIPMTTGLGLDDRGLAKVLSKNAERHAAP